MTFLRLLGRAFVTKFPRHRGLGTTRYETPLAPPLMKSGGINLPFQTKPFSSTRKVPRGKAWLDHLDKLNAVLSKDGSMSVCSEVTRTKVKAVYQPLLIENSSQFPLAKVGRAHFQQMLSNLDALDTEQRAILPWDLTEAHVSKFVKEILHCTLLSGKEPDLSLKAETRLESTKVLVRGRADYAITQGNTTLLAAEVKKYNLPQGVAQALLMLDIAFNPASLSNVVGVVTHLSTWYFFKRTVDRIYWSSDTIAKATRDRDAVRVVRRLHGMLQS